MMMQPQTGMLMFPPLLKTVQDCQNVCEHMGTHLLTMQMQDLPNRRMQMLLLRDCATICATLAAYLSRRSGFAQMTAGLCARICEMCGNECARFQDPHSQMCAQICLQCARECQQFAATPAGTMPMGTMPMGTMPTM